MTFRGDAVWPPCCRAARRASGGCAGSAGSRESAAGLACRPVTISLSIRHTGASLYASRRAVTSRSRVVPFSSYRRSSLTSRPTYLRSRRSGFEQVELVVLLEHAEARRLGQRADVHGCRIHGGRDVEQPQIGDAGGQRDPAHVAHQRDVRVVDGDREVDLILERGRWDCVVGRGRGRVRRAP